MAERNHVFETMRKVAHSFGFTEYDGPPLESLELYTRKSGPEIVQQLYAFEDKGGRDVALRPEMTPTLARMVATRGSSLPKPIKWFSIPQLFRYEKNQRGRLREHFQLNVDIVGASEIEADVELLAVALQVQIALGLTDKDIVARVNDRRLLAGALRLLDIPIEKTTSVYTAIDKFHKISTEEEFRVLLEKSGVPSGSSLELCKLCAGDYIVLEWFASRLKMADDETKTAAQGLSNYLGLLESRGLSNFVKIDFSIVRGLAYYTGIVFELYDRAGEERAICGGGRYDDLIRSLGGPDIPALGFGMGDVVLSLILHERGLMPGMPPRVDVLVIPVGKGLASSAWQLTDMLRREGIRAEAPFAPAGVGKDLKTATQHHIPFAIIIGPEELAAGEANLKNLKTGEQARLPIDKLAGRIREC